MKVRLKKIRIYLLIAIFFSILFPPFVHDYDLMKGSFFPLIPVFENPEQEAASTDYLNRLILFETNGPSKVFPPAAKLSIDLSNSSLQTVSLDQEAFPLRC